MSQVLLKIRGVPPWLLREYLLELGATAGAREDEMIGDGYKATWSDERVPLPGGTLSLTQLNIMLEGDEAVLAALDPELMRKLQRGGG